MDTGAGRASARQLPGGLGAPGALARDYAFRALDGTLELALAEAGAAACHTPDAVTRTLCAALASLAGAPPSTERVAALCVADRQVLMRELATRLGVQRRWLSAACGACRARFDLQLDVAELPTKPAGPAFPQPCIEWQGRAYRLRVPCGADQAWLADAGLAAGDAARALAARLVVAIDGQPADGLAAGVPHEAWLAAADAALDEAAPALATEALAACPECGHANAVPLDPYGALGTGSAALLDDVHRLASHYHWSERDILALPRTRRLDYLRRIDAERGVMH